MGRKTERITALEHYGIDPQAEAEAELLRVTVRFPAKVQEADRG